MIIKSTRSVIIFTIVLAAFVLPATVFALSPFSPALTLAAAELVGNCYSREQGERTECYRLSLAELYPKFSIKELFDVIRAGQEYDPAFVDCHFIAHKIGEEAVVMDPEAWVSLVKYESSELCSYGFIHGVTISAYPHNGLTEDELDREKPKFMSLCDSDRAILRMSCEHSLGHLMYYVSGGDVLKALPLCDQVMEGSAKDGGGAATQVS